MRNCARMLGESIIKWYVVNYYVYQILKQTAIIFEDFFIDYAVKKAWLINIEKKNLNAHIFFF